MALLKEFVSFCRQQELLERGAAVVVACSGGPDSLALLDLLWRLQPEWGLRLLVAHFEHGIRGEASRQDALFVADFCQERGLAFVQEAADVPAWAEVHGQSLETAARTLRYAFLRRQCGKLGPQAVIATAHHADDQAETVLAHLLRGSGLDGLSGMRPRAGAIIRPLLFTTKAAIGAYCRERQLTPRHDATNDLPEGTRNRLRLQLLPELARDYNPAVRDSLCRLAALAAADSDYLQAQAAALFVQLASRQADGWSLERAAFRALPLAMARRVLRQLVNALQGSCRGWEAQHFERLCSFIQTAETGKCLSLPGDVQAELIYDRVVFHPVRPAAVLAPVQVLQVPGRTVLTAFDRIVEAELLSAPPAVTGPEFMYCDYDRLPGPVTVRQRRPGDRLRLSGGTKKLKDILIDAKVPRSERARIPVFCAGEEILWLGGWRRAAVAAAGPDTRTYLLLKIRNHGFHK